MQWEIEERGADEIAIRIQAIRGFRNDVAELVNLAATRAGFYMKTHAPFHSGALYRAIFIHIQNTGYKPGGAGGGGVYEATVGIDREQVVSPSGHNYLDNVLEGTGIYNVENAKNGIYPAKGNVMVFSGAGEEKVFTRYTRGQQPQREWLDDAIDLAERTIAEGLHRGFEF